MRLWWWWWFILRPGGPYYLGLSTCKPTCRATPKVAGCRHCVVYGLKDLYHYIKENPFIRLNLNLNRVINLNYVIKYEFFLKEKLF